jgi:hypothetical protein
MRTTIAAFLLAVAVAAPAFAGPGDNPRRRLDFYDNAGTLHELTVQNDEKIAMFRKYATKLPPGTLLMSLDGQLFVVQDLKLPDGHMLSDEMMHETP